MKLLFNIFFVVLTLNVAHSQINTSPMGSGTYKFTSDFPQNDLHFYLFGDGHHSFENSPEHQFGNNVNPADVVFHTTKPYTPDEPIDDIIFSVVDGVPDATPAVLEFDNKISLKRSWNFVENQNDYLILMFENLESLDPISGCIEFHYNENHAYIDDTKVLDDYNNDWVGPKTIADSEFNQWTHKFEWTFDDLAYEEQRFIYIPAKCLAPPLTKLRHMAVMRVDDCDGKIDFNSGNNGALPDNNDSPFYILKSKVVNNPHDPNMILSNFECFEGTDRVVTINYRIYFQNEGVDDVEDVTLDYIMNLPITNLELVDASHSCVFNYVIGNAATPISGFPLNSSRFQIKFNDIFLPGLFDEDPTPTYESTIGWVEFNVCVDLNLLPYNVHCLNSQVDITFDLEDPITATNQICKSTGSCHEPLVSLEDYAICFEEFELTQFINVGGEVHGNLNIDTQQSARLSEIQLYPNPVNNLLNLDGDISELEAVTVSNTQGQKLISLNNKDNFRNIDVSDLSSGLYFLTTNSKGLNTTYTFVKQ